MIFKENINYYKETKVPVRIIEDKREESINPQKGTNFGLFKLPLKRIVKILLILVFLSAQVYLASAFESHVVNVTARICGYGETRTMGFWKNHPNVYNNCLPQFLGDYPSDFLINNEDDVNFIFDNANADVMSDMLKAQLLAMKFNIACFGIDPCEGEEFGGVVLSDLVNWADNLLRDPNSIREEQELVKDLLDYANNLHQIRYCSTEPSWLASALAEKPKKDKGPKDKNSTSTEDLETLLTEEELVEEGQVLGEEVLTEELPAEEPPAEEPPAEEEEPPAEEPPAEEPPAEESPPEPYCGDGECNGEETCEICPGDCGECPPPEPYCGDTQCNGEETCETCLEDCGECPPPVE